MTPARRLVSTALITLAALGFVNLIVQRGLATVAPVALAVCLSAAVAWFLHVALHEGAHALAALTAGFSIRAVQLGPLTVARINGHWVPRVEWAFGGRVTSWPRDLQNLKTRVQWVAIAGPFATVCITSALAWWQRSHRLPITSPIGIGVLMGLVSIVSALVPSRWNGSTTSSDVDQVLFGRKVEAAWTHVTVLSLLERGAHIRSLQLRERLRTLVPQQGAEPIVLLWALSCFVEGEFDEALDRTLGLARLPPSADVPPWLVSDAAIQSALVLALVKQQPVQARALLPAIDDNQSLPWFRLMADAAIAYAEGDVPRALQTLEAWRQNATASPLRPFATAGCQWAIDRMEKAAA